MLFHEYLKSHRGARKRIAERIGYHPTYLHDIATGKAAPSITLCRLLMRETRGAVTIDDLLSLIPMPTARGKARKPGRRRL